jgi:hypothetical protein
MDVISVGIATGWTAGVRFLAVQNFFFSIAFRPALEPTQPPVLGVPWTVSPGVKRPGLEDDHSAPSSAEVKNVGAVPALPLCLNGIVLN